MHASLSRISRRVRVLLAALLLATAFLPAVGSQPASASTTCGVLVGHICATLTFQLSGDGTGYVYTTDSTYTIADGKINCQRSGGITYGTCVHAYDTTLVAPVGIYYVVISRICNGGGCSYQSFQFGFPLSGSETNSDWSFWLFSPRLLTVSKSGSGTGAVTSSPIGIECGAKCSADFESGSYLTLTATAASGSIFKAWSGGCSGTSLTCTIANLASDTPVGAEFEPIVPPTAHITTLATWLNTTSIAVHWSATAGSGAVTSYDVRYRRAPWNGAFGGYATWLAGTSATSATFTASPGNTYCFSARAHDALGSVSAWNAETCTAVPLDDRSLVRYGTWTAGTSTAYYLGTYVRSTSYGAKLVRTGVVARRLAILATTCSTCGSVRVSWGSTLLRTISLYSSTTHYRILLDITAFTYVRTGTLTIQVSTSGKPVIIDGVAIWGV